MGRINRRRDRWLKRALEWALRPFFTRPKLTLDQVVARRPRRILLVRQHNQMGDMLCAVPTFRALRETFPEARTLLITAPINDGIVRGNPYLDQILLFDKVRIRSSPRAAWRFLRELRAFKPDLAFVLNSVSFSGTSAWLAVLSGAPVIVGGDSRPFGWSFSTWLYNLEMPGSKELRGHAIDHQLDMLRAIGIEATDRSTVVVPGPDERARAAAFLDTLPEGPRLVIHPGAGKVENRWPADRFAAVVAAMEADGVAVFLVEGPADVDATRETLEALGHEVPVLRGVDLQTVAAAVAASDLALVNDTGVMHLAGAVGTRTLALFGPTPAAQWEPPSEHLDAWQSPTGRMDGLAVEPVLEWLRAELSRSPAN